MMKTISILGSTGSIGTQALNIISQYRDRFSVCALSCAGKLELLMQQVRVFEPAAVCIATEEGAKAFAKALEGVAGIRKPDVYWGTEGLKTIATMPEADLVLNSLMGMRGLEPTLQAIEAGKDDKEVSTLLDKYLEALESGKTIDAKYVSEYRKFLSSKKVAKLFIAEEAFRRQQIHRLKKFENK